MAIVLSSNETLAIKPQVNQEIDVITAIAMRIYEVGAVYFPVEPDMYKVQSPDGADDAIIVSAHQFCLILSLVRSLKSCSVIL